MTPDQAEQAVSHLAHGLGGFPPEAINEYVDQFVSLTDADVLDAVCREFVRTWTQRWRPRPGEILAAYYDHPAVREAREARLAEGRLAAIGTTPWCQGTGWIPDVGDRLRPCPRCNPKLDEVFRDPDKWEKWMTGGELGHLVEIPKEWTRPPACRLDTRHDDDPSQQVVPWAEGQAIMNDAYRLETGRNIGEKAKPDAAFAEMIIQELGHTDRRGHWVCSFVTVLEAFAGDQRRCRASLDALGGRLDDDDLGRTLILKPPPEPLQALSGGRSPAPVVPDTPAAADDATEVEGRVMADALAETARLLGERP